MPETSHLPPWVVLAACLVPHAAAAACWHAVPEESELGFSVPQAGMTVQGRFRDFEGTICLDEPKGAKGRAEIRIRTGSVKTALPEIDDALTDAPFFHSRRWPVADFLSTDIRRINGNRYEAVGSLTIRDVTRDVTVPFTLDTDDDDQARISADLIVDRREFNVGTGEWRDSDTIGSRVTITLSAQLMPAAAGGTDAAD